MIEDNNEPNADLPIHISYESISNHIPNWKKNHENKMNMQESSVLQGWRPSYCTIKRQIMWQLTHKICIEKSWLLRLSGQKRTQAYAVTDMILCADRYDVKKDDALPAA